MNHSEIVSFLWGVADLIRDTFKRGKNQRSPEPVFLKWKGVEEQPEGDFYVRSGPGSVKLSPESAQEYIRTRFLQAAKRVAESE